MVCSQLRNMIYFTGAQLFLRCQRCETGALSSYALYDYDESLSDSMGAKLDSVELHIISIKAAAANGSWADLGTLSSKLLRKLQHPRPP